MSEAVVWRARPVFITSTFRDMHAERDVLRTRVFPELEERLKERFHHLEPIDLRWGVAGGDDDDEQAHELMVLKVCLGEIERSRPFLVGLLGDRYGWRPPKERMAAAAREAGLEAELADRSVTELEIVHGVLASTDQQSRSRFYFRKSLPYDLMDAETAAVYSERHTCEEGSEAAADRLEQLKQRIMKDLPDRWREYPAGWDVSGRTVTDLDAFARMVVEDLWADLEAETAAYLREAPGTWQGQDTLALEEFVEGRVRGFVGRERVSRELLALAGSPAAEGADWGVCVTGAAGAGKSSLFGHLHRELRARQPAGDLVLLSHAAGIGPGSGQVDRMLRRWVGELAEYHGEVDPLVGESTSEDVEREFSRYLGRTSTSRRVVVLIDALNQFEAGSRASHMTWLPALWPANARLIATAIPGTASAALAVRAGASVREIPALGLAEAREIAGEICRRYHRDIDDQLLELLLAKEAADGDSAAGNPLWLSLAVAELNLLDAEDFARLETGEFEGTGADQIRGLLLAVAEELPADVVPLYTWMLERSEKIVGPAFARGVVNLIAAGRVGWRESDLRAVLPDVAGTRWDELAFATLRRSFAGHLVQRGAGAQWDFFHGQLRDAVLARNLSDADLVKRIHDVLTTHLLSLPASDSLHVTETMVHLIGAGDCPRAAGYLGSNLDADETEGAARVMAGEIVAGEADARNPGLVWTASLCEQRNVMHETTHHVCHLLQFDTCEILATSGHLPSRQILLEQCLESVQRLAARDPSNAGWQSVLSVSHNKIGDVQLAQGDGAGALASYRASLEIRQRLTAQDPSNADWQRDLSISHDHTGDVQLAQGDAAGALASYHASLEIRQRLATQDPSNADWQCDLSVSHAKIGDVQFAQGDAVGALASYRASLGISQRLAAQDPSNAGWQRDLSASHDRIGNIQLAQGDGAGALASCRASLEISQHLAAQDPSNADWQRDLSFSHEKIGDVQLAQGDGAGALSSYRASLEIRQCLAVQDPSNAVWQRDLSASHDRIGNIQLAQGDGAGALASHRASLEICQRLAAQDPSNADWQRDLSVSHAKISDVQLAQGDGAGALASCRASLEISQHLAAQDSSNADWQRVLSVSHERTGNIQLAQGDGAGALLSYRASLEIRQRLATQDPSNAGWQRDLSVSHNKIGDVQCAQGDGAGALASYRASLEIGQRLASQDPSNADWQRDLVVSFFKLASLTEQSGDEARSSDYWRRCRGKLRAMKRAGMWLDPPLVQLLDMLDRKD